MCSQSTVFKAQNTASWFWKVSCETEQVQQTTEMYKRNGSCLWYRCSHLLQQVSIANCYLLVSSIAITSCTLTEQDYSRQGVKYIYWVQLWGLWGQFFPLKFWTEEESVQWLWFYEFQLMKLVQYCSVHLFDFVSGMFTTKCCKILHVSFTVSICLNIHMGQ